MADTKSNSSANAPKHEPVRDPITGAETTGHVWDDTLQEFNNPLPRWWLWAFYGTIVFSLVYWVLYPTWPLGFTERGFTEGVKTVSFKSAAGEEVTVPWNTRALLAYEMQNDPNELKRHEMVKSIAATPLNEVLKDPDKSAFVLAYGKGIFGDKCAACHQTGGQGVIGHYPNLVDDAWLWGGDSADIETTIRKGRKGNMPAHATTLSKDQIEEAANYVLSLSGEKVNPELTEKGKEVFNTKGCSGCHTPAATGMKALGSANLTDKIWTQANVPGAAETEGKIDQVMAVISNGIQREMPSFEGRLSDDEIKVLVAYLKLLSTN